MRYSSTVCDYATRVQHNLKYTDSRDIAKSHKERVRYKAFQTVPKKYLSLLAEID